MLLWHLCHQVWEDLKHNQAVQAELFKIGRALSVHGGLLNYEAQMIVLHFCLFNLQVRNSNFSAFIDVFTANTYVMVIVSDSQIPSEAIMINIRWKCNWRLFFYFFSDQKCSEAFWKAGERRTGDTQHTAGLWKIGQGCRIVLSAWQQKICAWQKARKNKKNA